MKKYNILFPEGPPISIEAEMLLIDSITGLTILKTGEEIISVIPNNCLIYRNYEK